MTVCLAQITETNTRLGINRLDTYLRENRERMLRITRYWLSDKHTAEDVLQDATLRACDAIHRGLYDTSKPFSAWFWTILKNTVYNKLSRDVRPNNERLTSLSLFDEEGVRVPSGLISVDPCMATIISQIGEGDARYSEVMALRSSWEQLRPSEQALLYAVYVEGKAEVEIAAEKGVNAGVIRTKLMRAKRKVHLLMTVELVAQRD